VAKVPAYHYCITEEALEAYTAADPEEQPRVLRAFKTVSRDPEGGAEMVSTVRGREVYGRWFGNWLILYYLDHPIRTVVITDCRLT
jgi:hypothetical protein